MTIEVRQILIKASVAKRLGEEHPHAESRSDYEAMKTELLEDCRKLIAELLREERER
jgi:hypothetical protein